MRISSITLISFSPTGTTRKVLEGIAQGTEAEVSEMIDLTRPESNTRVCEKLHSTLAILGAPVYGGRIPPEAVTRFRRLEAEAVPAVVVAVYGNRDYDDALLELRDIAAAGGFVPVAGAAFIGEHSFDHETTPIASGRPDTQDVRLAIEFGGMVRDKLTRLNTTSEVGRLHVPGNSPYKDGMNWPPMSPTTVEGLCNKCGECITACPTAAITIGDKVKTDESLCIRCTACVKVCPTDARIWEHPKVAKAANWLSANCHERREPEIYL
jgi:ferredoxin/flavodoxin